MGLVLAVVREGKRVALVPEIIGKIVKKWPDLAVKVQAGAGEKAGFFDGAFDGPGIEIVDEFVHMSAKKAAKGGAESDPSGTERHSGPDVVLCAGVRGDADGLPLKKGAVVVALTSGKESWESFAKAGCTLLALEKLPRTSRAQAMDVLSSQANLGGYAAVLAAAGKLPRLMPPLMTAAGSSKPANVLVLGVGVAGLQAIATARRLGAAVWAFDVRPEVAEQIKSLGAKVVEVDGPSAEGKGGYAGAMDEAGLAVLQEKLKPFIAVADVVISTAQVPGRPAPVLVSAEAVAAMRAGSVVVDLAAGGYNKAHGVKGGNCPLTKADEVVVTKQGVTLLGETDWPGTLAMDASRFWATNMLNLLGVLLDKDGNLTFEDELVKAMMVVENGKVVA